jgi:ABC-type sulfate transport system substrate-binding protein
MSFTLHAEQKSLIEYAMSLVTDDVKETFGNTNKNGNALYEVVRQWAEQKK